MVMWLFSEVCLFMVVKIKQDSRTPTKLGELYEPVYEIGCSNMQSYQIF